MKDKLYSLLAEKYNCVDRNKCLNEQVDILLANGIIALPCKVGDTVWHIDIVGFDKNMIPIREVVPFVVPDLEWILKMYFNFSRFYYPTKEAAEKALKGGAE